MTRPLFVMFVAVILLAIVYPTQSSKSDCKVTKNLFIEAIVQFRRCGMKSAVPATVCATCREDYGQMLRTYSNFLNATDVKYYGHSCAAEVIDQNRLNIIPQELMGVKKLWADANCADCYTNCNADFSLCSFSDAYVRYNTSLSQMDACIDRSRHNPVSPCQFCASEYTNFTQTYESIKSAGRTVCYDIEDGLLNTKKFWTTVWNCGPSPGPAPPSPHAGSGFAATISILFALAILGGGGFVVYRQYQARNPYQRTRTDNISSSSNLFGSFDTDL